MSETPDFMQIFSVFQKITFKDSGINYIIPHSHRKKITRFYHFLYFIYFLLKRLKNIIVKLCLKLTITINYQYNRWPPFFFRQWHSVFIYLVCYPIYIGWNAQSCNWRWKIHSGTGQITANQTNAPLWECFQLKIFHKMLFGACLWYWFGCIMLSCELLPSGYKRFVWLLTILHLLESNSLFYFSKTWKLL